MPDGDPASRPLPAELQLPATLLARYLFFLSRRPISRSNQHYLAARLAGLQSLGPLLARPGEPRLEEAASELASLNPGNFGHRAARLQALLGPLLLREPAPGVVVSARPPGGAFFAPVKRATLIFGPAIGVGDEILCFGAARRLRARLPGASLTVLSAYEGLWQRVPAVDRAIRYRLHAELVDAIRGTGPAGQADLVAMVDFEKPDLVAAAGLEPAVRRYVEVSVGGASAAAFDAEGGWLHRFTPAGGGARNHYARLEQLLDWLCGEAAEPATPGRAPAADAGWPPARPRAPRRDVVEVLVSPFTSKHEPSLVYWSRLLAGLAAPLAAADGSAGADGAGGPAAVPRLRLRLDPGPNLATERFAAALAQAVRAGGVSGAEAEVIRAGGRRTSSLADVLAAIESAEAVLTSDSFAAHAAPLAGCLTLVVAQPGLEQWRVPSPCSFYFEDSLPLPAVVAAMRQLLAAHAQGAPGNGRARPWSPPSAGRLLAATRRLAAALAAPDGGGATPRGEWCRTYEEVAGGLRAVVAGFDHWPAASAALLVDRRYPSLLPPLPPLTQGGELPPESAADLRRHGRARLGEWENSNLHKYLGLLETVEQALPGEKA